MAYTTEAEALAGIKDFLVWLEANGEVKEFIADTDENCVCETTYSVVTHTKKVSSTEKQAQIDAFTAEVSKATSEKSLVEAQEATLT